MRILKFIISGQSIKASPDCDFKGIVKGTKGYLEAEFVFDKEWDGCKKAAVFTRLGKDYPTPIIKDKCEIPSDALTWNNFFVQVVGEREGYRITTNKAEVKQNG